MKNIVDDIVVSLSKQEFRELKYLVTGKAAGEREDLKMLINIRKGIQTIEKNQNATHQTRKRLKKLLEQFALHENLYHDEFSKIHSLMETAKYLFRKNLPRQAWDYLLKAEQMAIKAEEYHLLDSNYDIQIAHSFNVATQPPPDFSVPALIQKWKDNKAYVTIASNANAALALLIHELRGQFSRQLSVDIDVLVNTILHQYGLTENVYDNKLKIYCKIVNLVCRVLREKREYESLKNYAVNSYNTLQLKKAIDKIEPDFLIDLLDAICVASLRSRDYQTCETYTRLYEEQAKKMQAHSHEYSYYDFIPGVGVCDLCLCINRLDEAKQVMLKLQEKYSGYQASARIYFLLRINLLAVHFSYDEFSMCIRLYNEIRMVSEKKILNEPGFRLELILFTDIFGVIFHYEEGDSEYALYLLDKLKRKYNNLLKRQDSKREKFFVRILEQLLSSPAYFKSTRFISEATQFVKLKQFIAGDFEYISMNAWLNSKLSGKSYYQCFLQLV